MHLPVEIAHALLVDRDLQVFALVAQLEKRQFPDPPGEHHAPGDRHVRPAVLSHLRLVQRFNFRQRPDVRRPLPVRVHAEIAQALQLVATFLLVTAWIGR
jgi:hypothetical protein